MAIETKAPRSRRQVLMAGLGALGGLVVGALGRPDPTSAAATGNVQLGHGVSDADNDSALETRVSNATADGIAISGAAGLGTGLYGYSATGTAGVHGEGGDTAAGLLAQSTHGMGASGASTDATPNADNFSSISHRTGVLGSAGDASGMETNTDEIGVYGYADLSPFSTGVRGRSHGGAGVFGSSDSSFGVIGAGDIGVYGTGGTAGLIGDVDVSAVGVYGWVGAAVAPRPPGGIAVHAEAEANNLIALNVVGKSRFSRSGRASIAKKHASKTVTLAGVTTASYVIATLQSNHSGLYVRAVVPASGKFTIYLSKTPTATVVVGYLVVN